MKLLACLTIGFNRISMKLLSLCVSFSGPATIDLKFIPSVSEISIQVFSFVLHCSDMSLDL